MSHNHDDHAHKHHGHDHKHHGQPPGGDDGKPFRVVPRWFFAVGAVLLLLVILTWVLI